MRQAGRLKSVSAVVEGMCDNRIERETSFLLKIDEDGERRWECEENHWEIIGDLEVNRCDLKLEKEKKKIFFLSFLPFEWERLLQKIEAFFLNIF